MNKQVGRIKHFIRGGSYDMPSPAMGPSTPPGKGRWMEYGTRTKTGGSISPCGFMVV